MRNVRDEIRNHDGLRVNERDRPGHGLVDAIELASRLTLESCPESTRDDKLERE